ncbi:type III PLP-dependent enzyme [Bartonella sp. DGB1]|uniref:type III PLP-dependent enzyme n=1 Tax=Bartonella sp. DGB1 TaxID=3239807 RepID=UPI00352600EF
MYLDKIAKYLENNQPNTPCILLDLSQVEKNFNAFRNSIPKAKIFYAIKANPELEVLQLLHSMGSCFDAASIPEIEMVVKLGAKAENISFGNTIKKESDILKAYQLGIRLFAVDSLEELEKIARVAPNSKIFCRILVEGEGAQWPLTRKFGCESDYAIHILQKAVTLGLSPVGVSFHVGSQQVCLDAWDKALKKVKYIFDVMEKKNINLNLINMGGGFPISYLTDVPEISCYGTAIMESFNKYFADKNIDIIIEPGRGMVGDVGVLLTEVVLISRKNLSNQEKRWIFLDSGKFNGLIETLDESIRYDIRLLDNFLQDKPNDKGEAAIIAGPTCDSADILYEKNPYPLPDNLQIGDKLVVLGAGAYTSSYASVAFNGFEPIKTYVIS